MSSSARFALLALQVKDYLRVHVEPHLTIIERLDYLQNYKPRIEFERSTLNPENRILIISPKIFGETVLDAILAQAIYGRDEMRKHCWFRLMYSSHAARLDSFPKEMIHELRQMQVEFYGEGSPANIHTTIEDNGRVWTPTMSVTGDNVLEDIFALLNKQKEETIALGKKHEAELFQQQEEKIELDDKHEAELRERFDTTDEKYPGLSGLLCGVQHSFRDRADRLAERKALLEATMDYIARIGP
ncbi:hypothetical protein BBO_08146 [Beauveria brongniartii RCEF 3172]|uniref:Uncharacterized protein n=1 Tax=Beauveria brongniartii RCEF 3172 TaxID=1081107 RepID=A0A166Y690_9HYPO|nr:hypothetical protein BBO_08146 [Beauveria brongniartii RCEF 3172]